MDGKHELVGVLGVSLMQKDERYLGAPLFSNSKITASHKFLVQKVHNKLRGWKSYLSSHASREVVIESSLVGISSFHMGLGLLHKSYKLGS